MIHPELHGSPVALDRLQDRGLRLRRDGDDNARFATLNSMFIVGTANGFVSNILGEDLNNDGDNTDPGEGDFIPNLALDKGILALPGGPSANDKAPFSFDTNKGGFLGLRQIAVQAGAAQAFGCTGCQFARMFGHGRGDHQTVADWRIQFVGHTCHQRTQGRKLVAPHQFFLGAREPVERGRIDFEIGECLPAVHCHRPSTRDSLATEIDHQMIAADRGDERVEFPWQEASLDVEEKARDGD